MDAGACSGQGLIMRSLEAASPEPSVLGSSGNLSRFLQRFVDAPVSFGLEMENGTILRLGRTAPTFHVASRSRRGMRALTSLNERRIANAYLAGHIDITGDMLQPFL